MCPGASTVVKTMPLRVLRMQSIGLSNCIEIPNGIVTGLLDSMSAQLKSNAKAYLLVIITWVYHYLGGTSHKVSEGFSEILNVIPG